MRTILLTVVFLTLFSPTTFAGPEQVVKDDVCALLDNASRDVKELHEGIPREQACRLEYWFAFKAQSAKKQLVPSEHERYLEDLRNRNCQTAQRRLVSVFSDNYPRAPDIAYHEQHRRSWSVSVVPRVHPKLAFCWAEKQLERSLAEIKRLGLRPARYTKKTDAYAYPSDGPRAVGDRNWAILNLFKLTRVSYPPAYLFLVKLSHEGISMRFNSEFQYYLLGVLKRGGTKDPLFPVMFAKARKRLNEGQIEKLERQILNGRYKGRNPLLE